MARCQETSTWTVSGGFEINIPKVIPRYTDIHIDDFIILASWSAILFRKNLHYVACNYLGEQKVWCFLVKQNVI